MNVFAHFYEHRAVPELAVRPVPMAVGALSGAALILVTLLALFAMGYYDVQAKRLVSIA